jgi:peptidyl-prolyl cis-trans isomerase C
VKSKKTVARAWKAAACLLFAGAVLLMGTSWTLTGCAKGGKKEGGAPAKAVTGEPTTEVAKVNKEVITLAEVNRVVQAWKSGRYQQVDANMPEAEMQTKAVDELIGQKLLYAEAVKAGTVPPEADVTTAIEQMKGRFPDTTAFRQALQQQGMTLKDLSDGYRTDTAIRTWLTKTIQDTINITPEQAKTYYDSHPEQFQRPEQVHARHILLRVDPSATPDQIAAAEAKIKSIEAKIRGGGDFGKLASENSEDPGSGARGGDLGFFGKGQMVAPFDSVAFALVPGQVSGPVRTQFGYHLIRVEEKKPAGVLDYSEVESRLMNNMKGMRVNDRLVALVEELKTKAKIKRKI